MTINYEKINFQKIAPIIAITFAIGFGVATGAFFLIFCPECLTPISFGSVSLTPDKKCEIHPPCVPEPPDPQERGFSKVGHYKIDLIEQIVNEPIIQQALIESNEEFGKMSPAVREDIIDQREKEWTTAREPTPFMLSIINNDVSDFLREKLVFTHEEFGDVVFGEHILTNIYGPNVAVSIKTDNYDQSNDEWWQESKKLGRTLVRQCEYDESAKMYSEDIVVKILDSNGEFVGIMNSATPCDVTQKALESVSKIEVVPIENITPIGKYKIASLQELMSDDVIQDALRASNEEFAERNDEDIIELNEKTDWPPPVEEPTSLQLSILNNEAANFLSNNLSIKSEEYGKIGFGEFILTNAKGVNIAITTRTYNYIQSQYDWWQIAVDNEILVRECGYDKSVKMTSEDIIIAIHDDKGEFVGVLNSATTCDVILNKSPSFFGDSN